MLPSQTGYHDHEMCELRQRCQCCSAQAQFERLALFFVSTQLGSVLGLSDRHHCFGQFDIYFMIVTFKTLTSEPEAGE